MHQAFRGLQAVVRWRHQIFCKILLEGHLLETENVGLYQTDGLGQVNSIQETHVGHLLRARNCAPHWRGKGIITVITHVAVFGAHSFTCVFHFLSSSPMRQVFIIPI